MLNLQEVLLAIVPMKEAKRAKLERRAIAAVAAAAARDAVDDGAAAS